MATAVPNTRGVFVLAANVENNESNHGECVSYIPAVKLKVIDAQLFHFKQCQPDANLHHRDR